MATLDRTHDAGRRSWVASANGHPDFPLQNLPLGVFRRAHGGSTERFRGGVAIGEHVLDLAALAEQAGALAIDELARGAIDRGAQPLLNELFALGPASWKALRLALFDRLGESVDAGTRAVLERCLVPRSAVEMTLPARVGDYSDFYTSYHHAFNIGRLFGISADAVPPNFHWLPIAYHGRASSLGVSGQEVRRPTGQSRPTGEGEAPGFGPCAWLDYEVELGVFVGTGNELGAPVPVAEADSHVFGMCLLNDWSARDLQGWEMFPLGPFLAKSFATTLSPWIVTMDALAPFRAPWTREAPFPGPPEHLDSEATRREGGLDIRVALSIETEKRRASGGGPVRLTETSFRHQHWTVGQMLAHHTSNGCNLQPGDLLGTGTISGPTEREAGALMELAQAGRKPAQLGDEERGFLADGDSVVLEGWCEKTGFARIGFGGCRGTVRGAR